MVGRESESPIRLGVYFSVRGVTIVFENDRSFSDWVTRRISDCAFNRDRIFLLGEGLGSHLPARKAHAQSGQRDENQTTVDHRERLCL